MRLPCVARIWNFVKWFVLWHYMCLRGRIPEQQGPNLKGGLKSFFMIIHILFWLILLSCTPLKWNEGEDYGCKSAIWEKKEAGVDLSMHYPGEVELDLKYPTLVSWVHFKHHILDESYHNKDHYHYEEILRGRRFFRKIGEKWTFYTFLKDIYRTKINKLKKS